MSVVMPIRWTARVLSALIVLFFGFFLVAHLFGDQGQPSRPLVLSDYIILTTLITSLVGLMLAWKWEFVGASITLVAILICATVNWKVFMFPTTLIPITALLYLFAFWMKPVSVIAKNKHAP